MNNKKEPTQFEKNIASVITIIVMLPVAINVIFPQSERVTASSKGFPSNTVAKVQEFNTSVLPEYCFPKYQLLSLETYTHCVHEGMSYVQVGNIIGNEGRQTAKSGAVEVWQWGETGSIYGNKGTMSATFVNGKLTSKAQYGLHSDRDYAENN